MDYTSSLSSHFPSFVLGVDSYMNIQLSQKQSSASQKQPSLLSMAPRPASPCYFPKEVGEGSSRRLDVSKRKPARALGSRRQTGVLLAQTKLKCWQSYPNTSPFFGHCHPPLYNKGQPRPPLTSQKRCKTKKSLLDGRDYLLQQPSY